MLFSANGRIRRRDFWLWSIAMMIFVYIAEFVAHMVLTDHPASQFVRDMGETKLTPFNMAILAIIVITQWPVICLNAKRWHDRNRTGYIAVAVAALNVAAIVVQSYIRPAWLYPTSPQYWVILIVSLVVGIWAFVECGCLDGTKGPNRYGPSPKNIAAAADVF